MAKTIVIPTEEREKLCAFVIKRYTNSFPNGQALILNAYLPNYDNLKNHIQFELQNHATSISNGRLRKLFYQTKNEDALTFGLDFIDTLYLYATGATRWDYLQKKQPIKNKQSIFFCVFMILLGIIVMWFIFHQSKESSIARDTGFEENFDAVSYKDVRQNGWEVMDYNANWFSKQDSAGMLTLYTLPGGYWVKPGEAIRTYNTLVRELKINHSRVKLTSMQFSPTQKWQGICLKLYDNQLDPKNSINYCFSYHPDGGSIISGYHLKSGTPYNRMLIFPTDSSSFTGDRLHLGMEWNDSTLTFSTGVNELWGPLGIIGDIPLLFKPSYVGISANQGYSDDDGKALNADTVPIYVDRIIID